MDANVKAVDFNEDQKAAIEAVVAWFRGWHDRKHRKQSFFLAGFAGTGKTSVAQEIAERCGGQLKVAFIAPTGKAASRLRQKGCKYAKTLHQFVYNVRGEDSEGDPIFAAKGSLGERPVLVICDEASMVGEYDARTLLNHGIPVLGLGDTGQLQPVKAAPFFKKDSVDFMLTKIERNTGNIVRASMFVREGKRLPVREYDDVRVRQGAAPLDQLMEHYEENSVILCGYNSTRTFLNQKVRKARGYFEQLPMVGEKVVCLFNQHAANFMNGEQGIVLGYDKAPDYEREDDDEDTGERIIIRSLTDGRNRTLKFNPQCFDPNEDIAGPARKATGAFDFGGALTIHKSQGSEWENVLLIEESMRGNYAELMYTGITRAILRLTMYRA